MALPRSSALPVACGWILLLLISALCIGITHQSAVTAAGSDSVDVDEGSDSLYGMCLSPELTESLRNPVPRAPLSPTGQPLEETDLTRFPADAHLSTPLTALPSALVPPLWSVDTDIGQLEVRRVFADPLLLTLERFLLPGECEQLIAAGHELQFHRSLTATGLSETRTSSSAYLPDGHALRELVVQRAAKVTGVPASHFEVGPVLRYEPGQQFDEHWDSTRSETFGRRLTFFVPLQSHPDEDGGHTAFRLLQYRFPPRSGSAVVWRNYMPLASHEDYDRRMAHRGEPPRRGTKFAINFWIYDRPYEHWHVRHRREQERLTRELNELDQPGWPDLSLREPTFLQLLSVQPSELENMSQGWWVRTDDAGLLRVHLDSAEPLLLRIPDLLTLAERQSVIREAHEAGWTGSASNRRCSTAILPAQNTSKVQEIVHRRVASLAGVTPSRVQASLVTRWEVGVGHSNGSRQDNPAGIEAEAEVEFDPHLVLTFHVTLRMDLDETGAGISFPALNRSLSQREGAAIAWRNTDPHLGGVEPVFSDAERGRVYTLTCFVFTHALRKEAESASPIAAQ